MILFPIWSLGPDHTAAEGIFGNGLFVSFCLKDFGSTLLIAFKEIITTIFGNVMVDIFLTGEGNFSKVVFIG